MKPNFQRMLALIDEVFATRKDPSQLQVNEKAMKKLQGIHPATLSEKSDAKGPSAWVLVVPTTQKVMDGFLKGTITEQELLDKTEPGQQYEAVYLCSATVLPEYRNKGLAKKLSLDSIHAIQKDHAIKYLFVWPFTQEGDGLAKAIAGETGLELKVKSH